MTSVEIKCVDLPGEGFGWLNLVSNGGFYSIAKDGLALFDWTSGQWRPLEVEAFCQTSYDGNNGLCHEADRSRMMRILKLRI